MSTSDLCQWGEPNATNGIPERSIDVEKLRRCWWAIGGNPACPAPNGPAAARQAPAETTRSATKPGFQACAFSHEYKSRARRVMLLYTLKLHSGAPQNILLLSTATYFRAFSESSLTLAWGAMATRHSGNDEVR